MRNGLYKKAPNQVKFLDLMKLPFLLLKEFLAATWALLDRLLNYPYLLSKVSNDFVIDQQGFIKITKRVIVSYLIVFLVFSGTGLLFLFNPFGTDTADAAWFNDNWAYRKALTLTIDSQSAARTNVYALLTIDTNLTSTKLQSACQDLRFTDITGAIIPYYIISTASCNTNGSNQIWVKIPTVPASTTSQIIYMYYGNPGSAAGASPIEQMPLINGLNGYWKMNESSGNAADNSVNANTLTNNNVTTYTSGQFGNAGTFASASSQSLSIADASQTGLDNLTTWTISTWIKASALTTNGFIVNKDASNGQCSYILQLLTSGSVRFNSCSISSTGFYSLSNLDTAASLISTGNWYHLVVSFDGATVRFYLNGAETTTGSFPETGSDRSLANTTTSPFTIGGGATNGGAQQYINGQIDDTRIYSRTLSAGDILALYSNPGEAYLSASSTEQTASAASEEKGPSPVSYWKFDDGWGALLKNSGQAVQDTQSGLIGYWKLDENTGTTITDSSGMGKTGTFGSSTAAPTWTSSGKYDAGVSFDGGDNIAISSPGLPTDDFTYSTWVNLSNVAGGVFLQAEDDSGSDTDEMHLQITNTNLQVRMNGSTVISATIAISTGTWYHIVVTRSGSAVTAYLDNAVAGSGTSAATLAFSDCELILGSDSTSACPTTVFASGFQGSLDEVRVYNRPLTTAQITAVYNQGPEPTTVNTPTWQIENLCVSAKCLYFDGTSNEYAVKYDDSTLDFAAADNFTVGAWVKRNGTASANTVILQKSTANIGSTYTGYKMYMDASGDLCFDIQDGTNAVDSACTSAVDFDDDVWHFVEGVKAATTSVTLYVDGKQRAQDASIASTGTLANASSLRVGIDNDGTSNDWLGFIDEVRVYRDQTARTTAQVLADYNARSNPEGVSQQQGNNTQNMPAALSNGLISYWKMDESAANTCTGGVNDSCDSSGNAKNAPWTGNIAATTGKFSNAITLDGTGDYISMGADATYNLAANYSFCSWFKTSTADKDIITNGTSSTGHYLLQVDGDGKLKAHSWTSSSNNAITSTTTVTGGTWTHGCQVVDNTNISVYVNGVRENSAVIVGTRGGQTGTFTIGARAGGVSHEWNGQLDEVRVYNRALSPPEVSSLYNWAPEPVGYWKLDENTGQSVIDSSGNGYNGDLGATSASESTDPGWTQGKFGGGIQITASDTDRTTIAHNAALNPSAITIVSWVKRVNLASSGNIVSKRSNEGYRFRSDGNGLIEWFDRGGVNNISSGSNTIPSNQWAHVAVTGSASGLKIYINGILANSNAVAYGAGATTGSLFFGGDPGGVGEHFNGGIDDVKIYSYERTAGQIVEDMNAGHPAPGSPVGTPVGFWKFNEGVDNTCSGETNDVCNSGSGSTTFDGTSTATRTNSGKLSRALDFDGTDDVVTITNASGIDLNENLANFTFSSWIYADSDGEADTGQIFNKGASTYFRVDTQGTTDLDLECNLDLATTDANVNVTDGLTTAAWNHVACSWNGTTMSIYINSLLRGSSSSGSGAISADANNLLIGGPTTANFDGKIDEFKVYNAALTASQIALDANSTSAQVLGATGNNSTAGAVNAQSQEYCIPGDATTCTVPVGRWDFETQSSNNQTHYDTSGNANNCTDFNGKVLSVGKVGKATDIVDGVGGSMTCGSGSTLDNLPASGMTIEGWIFPDSTGEFGQGMIARKNGYYVNGWWFNFNSSGTNSLGFNSDHATTDLARTTANNTVTLNAWNHVALTWTGSTTATTVKIYINGSETTYSTTTDGVGARVSDAAEDWNFGDDGGGTASFDGKVDQFRAFNYVRTPAQIAYDYNRGAPLAHWKMDECQGTTINDSSGNSLTGTLTNAATPGTCTTSGSWFTGVTGKRNYSLDFDGTNDYVNVADSSPLDITSDLTIASWVKPGAATNYGSVLCKQFAATDVNYYCEYGLFRSGGDPTKWHVRIATESSDWGTVTDDQWQHLAITFHDSTDTVNGYINGKKVFTSTAFTASPANSAHPLRIGGDAAVGTENFKGLIDDTRLFNYALTETQVKNIYNDGATRYGPVTGAP